MASRLSTLAAAGLVTVVGCGGDASPEAPLGVGAKLSVDYLGESDVIGFHYLIERVSCSPGDPIEPYAFEALVDLQDQLAPGGVTILDVLDDASGHVFADVFVTLDPGCYDVTATPVSDMDVVAGSWTASEDCSVATADGVEVLPEQTANVPPMISQCAGEPAGGPGLPAAVNHPPEFELSIDDRFGFECEVLEVCASVSDPDNDPLELVWSQTAGDALFEPIDVGVLSESDLEGGRQYSEQCATFVSESVGDYTFEITVYDLLADGSRIEDALDPGLESRATLAFPLFTSRGVEPACVGDGGVEPLGDPIDRAPGCAFQDADAYYCDPTNAAAAGFPLSETCPGGVFDPSAVFPVCASDPCETVAFTDAALEAAVRSTLGIPTDPITGDDMLGLTGLVAPNAGIANLEGLECASNLGFLLLSNNDLTDLAPLDGLTELFQVDVGFNDGISDLSPLAASTGMEELRVQVFNGVSSHISDLTPLEDMNDLRVLYLNNHDIVDIAPLAGKPELYFLQLSDNDIVDLSPLAGNDALVALYAARNAGIDDLSALSGAVALEELDVTATSTQPTFITDLSPIAGAVDLRLLTAPMHQISDLSPLAGMTQLTNLRLNSNAIADLSPLTGMTQLQQVWLQFNNGIDDLSPLAASTGLLELRVDTSLVQPSYITDLSPLSGMPSLQIVHAGGHAIADLSPLAGLANLTSIALNNNDIVDTSPLAGQCGLNTLFMQNNPFACPDATLDALEVCGVAVTSSCP